MHEKAVGPAGNALPVLPEEDSRRSGLVARQERRLRRVADGSALGSSSVKMRTGSRASAE